MIRWSTSAYGKYYTKLKYKRILEELYQNSTATIKLEQEEKPCPVCKEVHQGDALSLDLFTCVLEIVLQKLEWAARNMGVQINGKNYYCQSVDDIVVIVN